MEQTKTKVVRLYVVEQQEIYQEIYRSVLPSMASIELLQVTTNGDARALRHALSELHPDVLLLSTKKLDLNTIEELEQVRNDQP